MTMNEYKKIWLQEQTAIWKSLNGKKIVTFAVREPLDWVDEDETQPIFEHSAIRFMHLAKVWFECIDGSIFKITTSQDEDLFGLCISNEPVDKSDDRLVNLDCDGQVSKVSVSIDRDNIVRIDLNVGDNRRILIPGEVEPERDGYIIRKMDESILLFDSNDDYEKTTFGQSIRIDLKS